MKVSKDRLTMESGKAKDVNNRGSQRPTSQLSSLLAAKGLDRSNGSLRALEQSLRRSAPVPVSQTEVRKSHLPGKCEGYATDSSDDGQLSHEPSSSLMSSSVRIPQRKLRDKTEHEERLGLAASLEGSDSLQGFVPPHKMSMPSGNFLDLSSRPGSLYEGVGRKLRGFDAVRFRQSVMRQTGFLETPAEQRFT